MRRQITWRLFYLGRNFNTNNFLAELSKANLEPISLYCKDSLSPTG
jgi:hypothetical protein